MERTLENLIDIKGIKGMVVVVFIIVIAILITNSLPGRNEQTIEALVGIFNGYLLVVTIVGAIALVAFLIWLFRKFGNSGGMV